MRALIGPFLVKKAFVWVESTNAKMAFTICGNWVSTASARDSLFQYLSRRSVLQLPFLWPATLVSNLCHLCHITLFLMTLLVSSGARPLASQRHQASRCCMPSRPPVCAVPPRMRNARTASLDCSRVCRCLGTPCTGEEPAAVFIAYSSPAVTVTHPLPACPSTRTTVQPA